MRSAAPTWIEEFAKAVFQQSSLLKAPPKSHWSHLDDRTSGAQFAKINGTTYRIVQFEPIGWGFSLGLLGAQYERFCQQNAWPAPLNEVLQRGYGKARYHVLTLGHRELSALQLPFMTFLEERNGNWHLLELAHEDDVYWSLFTVVAHLLVNRQEDAARFDDYGDFLELGAPSIIQRHSTERLRKHISQQVVYDRSLCTHCLRCATVCNEMRAIVTEQGAQLLGPSEDFCTNCGLCQKRCSFLAAKPKQEIARTEERREGINEGGPAVYIHGALAERYSSALKACEDNPKSRFPYTIHSQLDTVGNGTGADHNLPAAEQFRLDVSARPPLLNGKPLLATVFRTTNGASETVLIRALHRAALVLQTRSGEVEHDLFGAALRLGLDVTAVAGSTNGEMSFPVNETSSLFYSLGRPAITGQSLIDLWQNKTVDLFLAPYADQIPAELHQAIMHQTGRQAQILSPHLPQGLPFSKNPLLAELSSEFFKIFTAHPELMDEEGRIAQEMLQDIPRHHALLHARYRNLAFASGHSACPSCAEAQVLAIPVYMAMAMSMARREIPQVHFTCETGCMSETLNKVNETAQKVPGGRTVFGGGFAFGEAITMAQDRAVRMGYLKKGRRYVVSQGGDGGAVIGLPAWLNALRQQAFLLSQRHANVLHFINITDTQVYSNTGGESSATSLLGMGTLTTPVGKFLLGNQKIQWNLINLAAEFPGILVASGHSANRMAMQEFWQLADRLGLSAIRWDVTPCPETGKFFGEDPDDLAEVMAHAGMLPEVIFVGRFRKRIAPYDPDDRGKAHGQWGREPKPITYWLHRDPRYRSLFQKNQITGKLEPRNLTAHFLVAQLESFRDQLNWQIDLETHLVRKAEEWTATLLKELEESWKHYRYRLEQFPYAMLFNRKGELKPEYAFSLEAELVRRILGWDQLSRHASRRDRAMGNQKDELTEFVARLEELEAIDGSYPFLLETEDERVQSAIAKIQELQQNLKEQADKLKKIVSAYQKTDPVEQELFPRDSNAPRNPTELRREKLYALLDRILEERGLASQVEFQQYRLAQQLRQQFFESGGIIRDTVATPSRGERDQLLNKIDQLGPFSVGVASLAGDRGIAINRIFANFFTAKGVWAGMAWQFGSSKRGTPVLSATFVDSKPVQRKDAMYSFPMAVLSVTNFEEMKRQPDLFFAQIHPRGFIIVNNQRPAETLWQELVSFYPEDIRQTAIHLREKFPPGSVQDTETVTEEVSRTLWNKPPDALTEQQQKTARKLAAITGVRMISVDMDGIMQEVTGSSKIVSNLVAVAPIFQALQQLGFPFQWQRDLPILTEGFPGAVIKNKKLLNDYYEAMEKAKSQTGLEDHRDSREVPSPDEPETRKKLSEAAEDVLVEDPSKYLMIMGGTLAGMVLSQIATAENPVFYIGFPITPAGNPFYAMAEAFANGHPYVVVDEVNPSEKVAAEKLLGVARCGGFLPVTFTASQGWRLFTEVIPQFVGARLEGLFLIAKRALAAPNLNIEESHTDFMSFRDDGGIMLAPKSIQEYVPALYLARLLTHFAKIPVVLSIGGITDTHKIGLVKVPSDEKVRNWLKRSLKDFDFLEHKLINRQGDLIVHGPSGTSAVYQETQSELEKAHQAAAKIYPYAVRAVFELTGTWLDELEVNSGTPVERIETLLVMQGSLYPNAVEALRELEEQGWSGVACMSVRCFNPFPEERLFDWFERVQRIAVLDRSNSFGSIPPLASRVLTSLARFNSFRTPSDHKQLRIMVGGLGGREITVNEMKEILLSSHLLFRAPKTWETELTRKLLKEDPVLQAMLQEAAASDLRNTDRHTRLPEHLRRDRDRQMEYEAYAKKLEGDLLTRNYTSLLANYHQVEFVGPREVLQETTLLQQILLYVEIHLARHGLKTGQAQWQHALLLLHYSNDGNDRELAKKALTTNAEMSARVTPALAASFGVSPKSMITWETLEPVPEHPTAETGMDDPSDQPRAQPESVDAPSEPPPQLQYSTEEARRIETVLTRLVELQGEQPLFYNPEDYEYELLDQLQSAPNSSLFQANGNTSPEHEEELRSSFTSLYRDVIDRTLHREVLAQHHAPELRELFEGEGLKRLRDLAAELHGVLQEQPPEERRKAIAQELERYLRERCLRGMPKRSSFYLEFYRNWVASDLLQIE